MSRPMIHCPGCGRELYQLRRPQCLWCGAGLTDEEFEQVAMPPDAPPPPSPQPMPVMPFTIGTPWFNRSWQRIEGNLFPLVNRSVSPWERKLRIAGAVLAVCVVLARLVDALWLMWRMHQTLYPMH